MLRVHIQTSGAAVSEMDGIKPEIWMREKFLTGEKW